MTQVTLHNRQEIATFRKNIANLRLTLVEFQANLIHRLINHDLLPAIKIRMEHAGFSQKIINGTFLDDIQFLGPKKIRIVIKSELFGEQGFDIALAREEGTKDHKIKPKGKDNGGADALHGGDKWPYFSKGHWVSGFPRLEIIKNTVKEFTPHIQDQYSRELREFLSKSTGGKL